VLANGKFINAITLADGTGPNAGLAADYQLPSLSSITAPVSITPASLTVSMSNTAVTKTYDGTTNAPLGLPPRQSLVLQVLVARSARFTTATLRLTRRPLLPAAVPF
jgi:hypothetical protein